MTTVQPETITNVHPFPAIKPGHRLVPARVARRDEAGVIVYIECPTSWCTEDHVAEPVGNVEDVMHRGDNTAELVVDSFACTPVPHQLYASIVSDPASTNPLLRAAHIEVEDADGGRTAALTPEMGEELADRAVAFAAQLRDLARTVRLHNAATSDLDEALRQMQGGAA